MDWDAFFTVHSDLPREGPGEPADVHWALEVAGLSGAVSVLDAGCGPGADTVTLAQALPDAQITGIEKHGGFVDEARRRVAEFGTRVTITKGDMSTPGGPYDVIWCAGALYFLGVTEGLTLWKKALSDTGAVAFSEPVLLDGPRPESVRAFWDEYPQITAIEGIEKRVQDAGYVIEGERLIIGSPWQAYYDPMTARIEELRAQNPSAALMAALDLCAKEAAQWRAARDHIAYALLVVRPA
ncbi:class I SAM-dependent methyltransferase [Marivita sp. S6314]|uniref:class I SAM-dependent methyltransferase n=1 Tax=Marivita sp. S6314 TaxID=2926406 RepID=UPI001FF24AA8|nr:class I SAM-dependent methyltransferase [Marivita sp. S6314]MCK0148653.1 class I SAM-dependent methyltransferase [Marivita sp. S6314]